MNKFINKKVGMLVIFGILFYIVINTLFNKLVINISDSHPGTLFIKNSDAPKIGDYVTFEFSHDLLPQHIKKLSKKLVCVAGDELIISETSITCNQKIFKISREVKTKSGNDIPQFYYTGLIPEDMAIVWGENNGSFDSRYWGFIEYDNLKTIKLIF